MPLQILCPQCSAPLEVEAGSEFVTCPFCNASIGNIQMPPSVLATATNTLNNSIGDVANNLPSRYTLQTVTVTDGLLTITASQ